jgi:arsenate reductase-like glutaredoxin family protein
MSYAWGIGFRPAAFPRSRLEPRRRFAKIARKSRHDPGHQPGASMKIYGLKNCDTCRAALKALAGHGAVLVDIRDTPLDDATRARFLDRFGEALVNRRSTTWRGLSDDARAGDPASLLTEHPALMKRPVIDTGSALYLGWDAGAKAALGLV